MKEAPPLKQYEMKRIALIFVSSCNVREYLATYILLSKYIRLVDAVNPDIVDEFGRQMEQRCSYRTDVELMVEFISKAEAGEAKNGVEKLECIIEAIRDAVQETDLNQVWDEYKKDLDE